jgi:hypothetical protein
MHVQGINASFTYLMKFQKYLSGTWEIVAQLDRQAKSSLHSLANCTL